MLEDVEVNHTVGCVFSAQSSIDCFHLVSDWDRVQNEEYFFKSLGEQQS